MLHRLLKQAHSPHLGVKPSCVVSRMKVPLSPLSLGYQMLYSPEGGCSLQGATPQPAAAPSCPAHRSPPDTSAELGESKPGGGRAADLDD